MLSRRIVFGLIGVGVLIVVSIFLAIIVLITLARPVEEAGDKFFTALQNENLDTAYSMLTSDLQNEISFDLFQDEFSGFVLQEWKYTDYVESENSGRLEGDMILLADDNVNFVINWVYHDAQWQISDYNIVIE